MGTVDLKVESGVRDRAKPTAALDELQACMKVVPGEVLYVPKFTYIWYLAEGRFAGELKIKVARDRAVTDIARAYLNAAGQTRRELSRVTGLWSRRKRAERISGSSTRVRGPARHGVYRIASLRPGEWTVVYWRVVFCSVVKELPRSAQLSRIRRPRARSEYRSCAVALRPFKPRHKRNPGMKRYPAFDPPEYVNWAADPDLVAEYADTLERDPARKARIETFDGDALLALYAGMVRNRLHDITPGGGCAPA